MDKIQAENEKKKCKNVKAHDYLICCPMVKWN
jgi:hypothetical protein